MTPIFIELVTEGTILLILLANLLVTRCKDSPGSSVNEECLNQPMKQYYLVVKR